MCFTGAVLGQTPSTAYAIDAYPLGGKEQLDQVLETQLTLPKTLLTSQFETASVAYFDVDSSGKAVNIKVEKAINNALRNEIKRMFGFLRFARTQNVYGDPYVLNFKFNTDKYDHYFKQKSKFNFKKPLPADSSFIVYSKADRSPEYYRNGEEGLEEFIRSQMEYPRTAVERSIEGTVVLEFIVETNGYITDLKIKQNVGGGCGEEALRVMKQTKWLPAISNNKFVRYKTTYPITFNLRNRSRDNSSSQMGQ